MNAESILSWRTWRPAKLPWFSREFLCRAAFVPLFVTFAELLRWEWLRYLTSEVILRLSALLGLATARVSFDTIRVQGGLFEFVVSCTFVDVFLGSIPLIWDFDKSLLRNLLRLTAAATALFGFNLVRLEIGHILYWRGVPWVVADGFLGGLSYFVVWLAIWRQRSWDLLLAGRAIR